MTPTPTPAATPPPATPSPTPAPSATPTAAPTLVPTAPPTPTPACVPEPGDAPVSIRQEPRCRPGFEPLEFQESATLCGIKAGTGNSRTAWRIGYGTYRQGIPLVTINGVFLQCEEDRGCVDALGRHYPDGITLYTHPEGPSAPYAHGGYVMPDFCGATPTPTATPTPGGPTPTPPAIPQPEDFRLNFVNTCGALHYTKRLDDGSLRSECDGTYRFIGTLANGERYGNSCDVDHFGCAIHDCHGASPDELLAHRKTYELCGGRDWDSPLGVELHVDGARFEQKSENPFQHYVYGDGTPVQIYGCLPRGARTHDGRPIPVNGDGCGGAKTVTWDEVR